MSAVGGSRGDDGVSGEGLEARLIAALAARQGLVAAYLFGSRAEGRAHRESDVDLGVLLDWRRFPSAAERFELRLRWTVELGAAIGRDDLDLVVLNDAPPLFARAILHRGRLLLALDPEARHAWERDVQLLAADLAPFLERARRLRLEGVSR